MAESSDLQRLPPRLGELIGLAALVFRKSLDESVLLQAPDGTVERARPGALVGHHGDVVLHRIAVLRAAGETDQDEQRGLGEPAELGQSGQNASLTTTSHVASQGVVPASRCLTAPRLTVSM
jgi:hypothetical protein